MLSVGPSLCLELHENKVGGANTCLGGRGGQFVTKGQYPELLYLFICLFVFSFITQTSSKVEPAEEENDK